jgi:hypothetical protein
MRAHICRHGMLCTGWHPSLHPATYVPCACSMRRWPLLAVLLWVLFAACLYLVGPADGATGQAETKDSCLQYHLCQHAVCAWAAAVFCCLWWRDNQARQHTATGRQCTGVCVILGSAAVGCCCRVCTILGGFVTKSVIWWHSWHAGIHSMQGMVPNQSHYNPGPPSVCAQLVFTHGAPALPA